MDTVCKYNIYSNQYTIDTKSTEPYRDIEFHITFQIEEQIRYKVYELFFFFNSSACFFLKKKKKKEKKTTTTKLTSVLPDYMSHAFSYTSVFCWAIWREFICLA